MTVLPEEYKDSICEIKNLRNDVVAVGRIFSIAESDLEFANPEDDKMPLLPYNMPVKIYIFNSRLGFKILAGTVFVSSQEFLRVSSIRALQDAERRGFFRLNAQVPTNIYKIIDKEKGELDMTPMSVMLEDISLSGLRFSTETTMQIGEQVAVEVLLIKRKMLFYCQLVRQAPSRDRRNHYGCSFFNQTDRQLDDLCYDIFQLQRLEIKRRRDRN